MEMNEQQLRDSIFIDFNEDVMYGSDQMNISHPVRFATVEFELSAAKGLIRIADKIRMDLGFKPMHPMDSFTDDMCDNDGWYDFYIGINDTHGGTLDSFITFFVVNSDSEDNEQMYTIPLNIVQQRCIYSILDKQCRQHLGKGSTDLLAEARDEM